MKILFAFAIILVFISGCTNNKREVGKDSKIMLRNDTLNSVKLTDTLIIYESACRGCAYEGSTNFEISDTSGIIKLEDVITTDNNPSNVEGGSVSKDLILVPVKTGTTVIKMYKFIDAHPSAQDSARFTSYTIEVHN
jgi:hypothetical protein